MINKTSGDEEFIHLEQHNNLTYLKALFFFFVFGGLQSDLSFFAGLLGLSVALNGPTKEPTLAEQPSAGMELNTEYIRA